MKRYCSTSLLGNVQLGYAPCRTQVLDSLLYESTAAVVERLSALCALPRADSNPDDPCSNMATSSFQKSTERTAYHTKLRYIDIDGKATRCFKDLTEPKYRTVPHSWLLRGFQTREDRKGCEKVLRTGWHAALI